MKKVCIVFVLMAVLFGCKRNQKNVLNNLLNPQNLTEQTFSINTTSDTTLFTTARVKIIIAANSIKSSQSNVTLLVKEALNIQQILLAGLTTKSQNGVLRSGGMIYIDTKEGSTIEKPIKISLPASNADAKMELYKGEVVTDSSIEWKDPKPLASIDTSFSLLGKRIFKENCSSCHAVNRDLTGPSLKGVTKRVSKKWLHAFIKNNQAVIASGDRYANDLYNKYNKTAMNFFPNLTYYEVEAIISYIERNENNNEHTGFDTTTGSGRLSNVGKACFDSCYKFLEKRDSLALEINQRQSENSILSNVNYAPDTSQFDNEIATTPMAKTVNKNFNSDAVETVNPVDVDADYYTFNIDSYGWYNVDIFLKGDERFKNSKLIVNLTEPDNAKEDIYLVIPSEKVFTKAGKLANGLGYGFYSVNGDIPLPQNVEAFVFAFGEAGDKSLFGIAPFYTRLSQTVKLHIQAVDKNEILAAFKSYNFTGLNMGIDSVKKKFEIDVLNKRLDSLNNFRSNYCKCMEVSDTSQPPPMQSYLYP